MNHFLFPFHLIPYKSKIVLYGAGDVGLCFYKQLETTQYADVVLWADKNWKDYIWRDYPVNDINRINDIEYDYVVIAINDSDIVHEVAIQLETQLGVERDKIIYSDNYFCIADYLSDNSLNGEKLFNQFLYAKNLKPSEMTAENLYNERSLFFRRYRYGKDIKVICKQEMPVNDLILAQYYANDYTNYEFCDLAVRMMAVEEFYGFNNYGFDLYRRMQLDSGFDWTDRFKELIKSYENYGEKNKNVLELDRDFAIMDGAHRLTLALYHGYEFVQTNIYDSKRNRNFDKNFFWKKEFSKDECDMIQKKTNDILDSVNYDFIGVIWPPAMDYADSILNDINTFSSNVSVIEQRDLDVV